ncbi:MULTISPECIES: hypothetical protein [Variovorax]|uniref:hypothetical protein n=1 Tax=Variovorax TaxID=34072 RepID=UPI002860D539|nr:hypothetical protein [Variovorax sp. 3319]MDR6891014.1 hypothetical protein [Variovorax sp. 3319]
MKKSFPERLATWRFAARSGTVGLSPVVAALLTHPPLLGGPFVEIGKYPSSERRPGCCD